MSREIKFRAWDSYQKIMFYDCDTIRIGLNGLIYFGRDWDGNMTEITTPLLKLMQYTGLKDKNGVEIYEGDVVKNVNHIDGNFIKNISEEFEVRFQGVSFQYFPIKGEEYKQYTINPIGMDVEIIGNIYENPELLKEPTP